MYFLPDTTQPLITFITDRDHWHFVQCSKLIHFKEAVKKQEITT